MAASPDHTPLEDLTTQPGAVDTSEQLGAKTDEAKSTRKGKKSADTSDNKNLINCKVFLPDGTTISVDVDVSVH